MTSQATTVRVLPPTHEALAALAPKLERSMTQVVADAVELYARKVFWEECQRAYERLQDDPADWADYLAEQRELDGTLRDGLDADEEWGDASAADAAPACWVARFELVQ